MRLWTVAAGVAVLWLGVMGVWGPQIADLYLPVGDGRCHVFEDGTPDLRDDDCGRSGGL